MIPRELHIDERESAVTCIDACDERVVQEEKADLATQ
jgi:hypothetical protein